MKKGLVGFILALIISISALPITGSATSLVDLKLNTSSTPSGTLETDGYHWDSSTYTLELNNFNMTGSLTLPDNKPVTIKAEGVNTIGRISQMGYNSEYRSALGTINFTGNGEIVITDMILSNSGDTFIIAEGTTLTSKNSINVGASGGTDSYIEVNGTLNAFSDPADSYLTPLYCGTMKISSTGVVNVKGANGIQLNGRSSGPLNNFFVMENGAKLTTDCTNYGLLIFLDYKEITTSDIKNIAVVPDTLFSEDSEYELAIATGDNGGTQYAITIALKGKTPPLVYGSIENGNAGKIVVSNFEMTEGKNNSWNHGNPNPLTFRANCDFNMFNGVKVDANTVDSSNYTAAEGSTIITLKSDYLATLGDGNHNISILYNGGAVTDSFSVTHNYNAQWKFDENNHWKECDCGAIISKEAHNFVEIIDTPATSNSAGSKHMECSVCGYKLAPQTIPALGGGNNHRPTPGINNKPIINNDNQIQNDNTNDIIAEDTQTTTTATTTATPTDNTPKSPNTGSNNSAIYFVLLASLALVSTLSIAKKKAKIK